MFGQYTRTVDQESNDLDALKNKKLHTLSSTATTKPVISSSTTGHGLFRTVGETTVPSHTNQNNLNILEKSSTTASSTLLPFEGRITASTHSNTLPIFFAGSEREDPTIHQKESTDLLDKKPSANSLRELASQTKIESDVPPTDTNIVEDRLKISDSNNDEIRTIKIFGFPPNMITNVRKHFERYGKIEDSQYSPGSWLSIRYEKPASATQALDSNEKIMAETFKIGVTLANENLRSSSAISASLTKADGSSTQEQQKSSNVFKDIHPKTDSVFAKRDDKQKGVGSGRTGISVIASPSIGQHSKVTTPQTTGWIGYIRDLLFTW
ncbi:uncharacterized protein BX664DRAFT_382971 [Halteromyces radiatus]|uniref:uncharacterized protein n=1 Tax=Halteromyces radiatus TaxID=101107 RepID=UPI0022201D87|nr:uncharacterized protein BX664DRAFT_382971 [Halteromyces radiatus]KAI8096537.1 hypothetical protein BX664DRAFT_382971 [Halteromyces radiatus]